MKKIIILTLLFIGIYSCEENNTETSANIKSTAIITESDITFTSAKIEGNIITNTPNAISSRGICWSKEPNPNIDNNITTETNNVFTTNLINLTADTNYYFRVYTIIGNEIHYSEEKTFKTLSLKNTTWHLSTYYNTINDFKIISEVNFYADNTTKFDELDLPNQCPGCFVTYGTWHVEDNELTYIWESSDANNSTYIYNGTLNEMTIEGEYSHTTQPDGIWTATMQ